MRSKRCVPFLDGANVNGVSSVDNTAVYKIPADRDTVAVLPGRAVKDGNNDDTQIGICTAECERPNIGEQEALRAF
jgi:hypothetical protein